MVKHDRLINRAHYGLSVSINGIISHWMPMEEETDRPMSVSEMIVFPSAKYKHIPDAGHVKDFTIKIYQRCCHINEFKFHDRKGANVQFPSIRYTKQ